MGFYIGLINRNFWDSINEKFEQANYNQWDSSYKESFDTWLGEIVLYYSGKRNHIILMDSDLPDSLRNLFYWMTEIPKRIEFKQSSDSQHFETWVQNGFPRIPDISIKRYIPINHK